MKQVLPYLIGKVVSRPLAFAIIKAYAFRTPHAHLYDLDGSLYMGRWRVVDEGTLGGRILSALTGFSSIRLHHINREDHDRDLHNHPFSYRTFILKGYYQEDYEEGDGLFTNDGTRFLHRGQSGVGAPDKFHSIRLVSNGGVWTLFCMSRNTDKWGFKVDGRLVDSLRYFIRNGYTRDAIRAAQTSNRKEGQ